MTHQQKFNYIQGVIPALLPSEIPESMKSWYDQAKRSAEILRHYLNVLYELSTLSKECCPEINSENFKELVVKKFETMMILKVFGLVAERTKDEISDR